MTNTRTPPYGVNLLTLLRSATTTTTQRLCSDLWSHRSVITGDDLLDAVEADPLYGGLLDPADEVHEDDFTKTIAQAHVFSAPTALWTYREVTVENLQDLYLRCQGESTIAATAVYRAMLELTDGGMLELLFDKYGAHPDRVLILDWVEVAPRWRGFGIGRRLAARCLYVAGASDTNALVLATTHHADWPETGVSATRSAELLAGPGLLETPSKLWAGLCSLARPGLLIEQLVLD